MRGIHTRKSSRLLGDSGKASKQAETFKKWQAGSPRAFYWVLIDLLQNEGNGESLAVRTEREANSNHISDRSHSANAELRLLTEGLRDELFSWGFLHIAKLHTAEPGVPRTQYDLSWASLGRWRQCQLRAPWPCRLAPTLLALQQTAAHTAPHQPSAGPNRELHQRTHPELLRTIHFWTRVKQTPFLTCLRHQNPPTTARQPQSAGSKPYGPSRSHQAGGKRASTTRDPTLRSGEGARSTSAPTAEPAQVCTPGDGAAHESAISVTEPQRQQPRVKREQQLQRRLISPI